MAREQLAAARRFHNMSQTQLAKAIGVTPATVCKYESGALNASEAVWKRIASVLGAPVDRLWRLTGPETQAPEGAER